MEWSQLAPALTRIGLSSLGAALGGPAGAILANTLGPVIAEAVGGPAATPASTQAAIEKDPAAAAEKLQALEDGAAALLSKQIDLNAAQAGSASFFIAAARPAAFWAADLTLLYGGFLQWILAWVCVNLALKPPPMMDAGVFSAVLALLFGLCGVRAWEKDRGIARESWTAASPTGALVEAGAAILAGAAGAVARTERR
jgi:heme A synthase